MEVCSLDRRQVLLNFFALRVLLMFGLSGLFRPVPPILIFLQLTHQSMTL